MTANQIAALKLQEEQRQFNKTLPLKYVQAATDVVSSVSRPVTEIVKHGLAKSGDSELVKDIVKNSIQATFRPKTEKKPKEEEKYGKSRK